MEIFGPDLKRKRYDHKGKVAYKELEKTKQVCMSTYILYMKYI